MKATDFLTNLFIKFVPVGTDTLANLNVQLSDIYGSNINSLRMKNEENAKLEAKAKKLDEKIKDPATTQEEKDAFLFDMTEQLKKIEKPTIMERIVDFLDKPMVRLALLISFAFVARYLSKKLTKPVEPEEPEEPENEQPMYNNFGNQPYYGYQPPFYPQNGYYPPNAPSNRRQ